MPVEVKNRAYNRYLDPAHPAFGPGFGPVIKKYFNPDHGGYQPQVTQATARTMQLTGRLTF
jgi:hypothetical protein